MKISKVEHLENTEPTESDLENENIQLDIDKPIVEKKKRVYKKKVVAAAGTVVDNDNEIIVKAPDELVVKPKRTMSEAQLLNWSKCIQAREANRLKRKEEKEEQEKQRKADLENKIIVKASRIKKAQSKVLGNLDELNEDVEIPKVAKKQKIKKVVIYKSESENESDYEEEKVIQKPKVAKKQIPVEPVQQQLKQNIVRAIQFV